MILLQSIELGTINEYLNKQYTDYFIYFTTFLAVLTTIGWSFNDSDSSQGKTITTNNSASNTASIFLGIAIILYFGLATIYGIFIGDTILYEWSYRHIDNTTPFLPFFEDEALFLNLQTLIYKLGGHEYYYFAIVIALIYVGSLLLACHKLISYNIWVTFLFCITSFSFFSYGTNGIRNGAACHLVLLGIVYLKERWNLKQLLALTCFLFAFLIHRSSILPILCAIFCCFFRIKPHVTIAIWFVSIIISIIFGNAISNLFLGLGFDSRFDKYYQDQLNIEQMQRDFAYVGFRFDFLLYSAVPIFMVWYLTVKRNFQDKVYNIIANTYILSNAFWILVIRASYSNRFAYLSWFLYPIIIAYPLLRMNIWENQNRKTALILFVYSCFTYAMFLLGKI